jgi:hypothetical protein
LVQPLRLAELQLAAETEMATGVAVETVERTAGETLAAAETFQDVSQI